VLEVTVRGQPDPEIGYIMDLSDLKDVLNRAVADKCDHRNLNTDVPFLKGINPSTENLVIAFWHEIAPQLPRGATLHCVRLYETPRNYAEFFGEDTGAPF
jgi:6-pyruvoyltetrahydropterin/6-carboxytetrahydropterin synthase